MRESKPVAEREMRRRGSSAEALAPLLVGIFSVKRVEGGKCGGEMRRVGCYLFVECIAMSREKGVGAERIFFCRVMWNWVCDGVLDSLTLPIEICICAHTFWVLGIVG